LGIIESYKGKIGIEGKKNEGATLRVYLPVEQDNIPF
jgi:light-regulated signal transduction histidine kinase (bacteriophytochrome)